MPTLFSLMVPCGNSCQHERMAFLAVVNMQLCLGTHTIGYGQEKVFGLQIPAQLSLEMLQYVAKKHPFLVTQMSLETSQPLRTGGINAVGNGSVSPRFVVCWSPTVLCSIVSSLTSVLPRYHTIHHPLHLLLTKSVSIHVIRSTLL